MVRVNPLATRVVVHIPLFVVLPVIVAGLVMGSRSGLRAQAVSGLVAAYSFDQGTGTVLTDSSGNANHGTISGPTWTAQGKFGSALSFDGINDVVTIDDAASLDLTTGMTLEAWVSPTQLSQWQAVIAKERSGRPAYGMYANTDTDRPSGQISTPGNRDVRGIAQLPVNAWTHLAVTYDGSALRLYVDGTEVASRAISDSIVTSTGALRIGGNTVRGEYFQGLIDEVRIFNRALSQAEIQSDMNAPVVEPPRLIITQPASGSTIDGTTVDVTYTASGDLTDVDHVHFQLDSNPEVMDMSFDGSYQFVNVPPGSHVLAGYLARSDHSKIAGTDASVSFSTTTQTDTVPPAVSVTSPASGATVSGTITVSADASDNVGVAGVQFLLDGANLGIEDTTAPYSTSWDTTTTASGSHTLSARARDAAGNQTVSSPVAVTVVEAPKLIITQPASGSTIDGTTVDVTYTTSGDLTEVDHVHFRLDSHPEVMDMSFDGSYRFVDVPPGSHVLAGYLARSNHSTIAGSDASVSFSTTQTDTVPPAVSVTSPASGATVSGTITVSADASDNVGVAGVQFLLDGVNLGDEDTTAPYSITWNTAGASGSHALSARARDAAGNQTVSSPVAVTVVDPTDPAQVGQWSGPTAWPAVAIHSILLETGEVLLWDHVGGSSSHLWNPATGSLSSVPNSDNLFCAGHAVLADGRPLVIGGEVSSFVGIPDVNTFDPVKREWSAAAPMAFARWYPTATTLPDGRVLALAGTTDCSTCNAEIPEIYDPTTNSWTQLTAAALSLPTYPFMFVLPDGRVLNAGANVANIVTRVLDVDAQTWTTVDPIARDGGSAAMYTPGKIVKSGTSSPEYAANPAAATTYVLDMTQPSPQWRQTASMAFPRAHHNLTLLPDGTVLATGGGRTTDQGDGSQGIYEAELWSPATETWKTMARMQVPRLYHSTALLLPDGRVMTAGGESGTRQPSVEVYSPPYLFKGARPAISAVPAAFQHGATFFVETPDSSNIASVSLIRPGAVTHGFDMEQRLLNLTFQQAAGGLDVQAPGHASLAPPGSYMLFIVNAAGVPSIASFVRLTEEAIPPVVSVTAPASGSTVSGTIQVSADATDNVSVAAVEFFVDAVSLGTDSTVPYSVSWNTAGTANGPHTVTAVARDRAGNQASSSVSVTVSNTNPLPAGLVAAYSFDDGGGLTLADDSVNNNHGTLSGPAWTTGRFGGALSFDGVDDWVTVNDASSLDLTTGMTVEAWVFPTSSLSGWRTVALKEQSGHLAYALYANTDTNRPSGEIFTAASSDTRGTTSLPLDAWTHLAVTYDGAVLRLYVNGTQESSRSVSGSIVTSTDALRIGGNGVWGEYFPGRIDELRIYKRALTAGEIQTDMNTPIRP